VGEMTAGEAGMVFVDPAAYADEDRFHGACTVLRREAPVHRVEHPQFNPFYAVTRYADVLEVESHPDVFTNAPRGILQVAEADRLREAQGDVIRTLTHMDGAEHRAHRAVTADWFLPKGLGRYQARIDELARRAVDGMGGRKECEFVEDVAAAFPLQGILAILGLPDEDYPRMLQLTQEIFGKDDPDQARGPDAVADLLAAFGDCFLYFYNIIADRRARPSEDLASVIANSTIDGCPMGDMEMISYYIILAAAGHDTTTSTIAGGLHALAERPEELQRLQGDRSLLPAAVEEMIRWVTPVKHFMRSATVDYELNGTLIRAGESVLLSYPSANRDEDVFPDPFRFDVGRSPNRHAAFGFGPHFCLGAQFARMEIRALFAELLPRLAALELAGRPEWTKTLFVGGLKRLPIRYELRPGS
jgi:cytochrome P450